METNCPKCCMEKNVLSPLLPQKEETLRGEKYIPFACMICDFVVRIKSNKIFKVKVPIPVYGESIIKTLLRKEDEKEELRCPKCNTKNKLKLVHEPFTNERYDCQACGTKALRREDVEE